MLSSIGLILVFTFLFQFARQKLKTSSKFSDDTKDMITWGLCSLELGCVALEQGVLMEEAGMLVWALSLVMVVTWQIATWDGLSPNALGNIVQMSRSSLSRVPAMLVGSLISYRLMSYLWMLELSIHHKARGSKISSELCHIPWSSTPLILAMMTEYLGTLVLVTIPRLYIFTNQTLANNDANMTLRGMLTGFLVLLVVLVGMDMSGAMYNPTLAAVLVGGCGGYSLGQHVLVYWLPPVLAAFSGDYLCTSIENKNMKAVKRQTIKKTK